MTIYGERNDEFRPQPKKTTVLLFCTSMLLLAMQLAVITTGLVHFVAISGWTSADPFPIYAPVAQRFQLSGVANVRSEASEVVAPAAALVIAALALYFWPTRLTLASRVTSQLITVAFLVVVLSIAFEVSPRVWIEGDIMQLRFPVAVLLALFLLQQVESRAITLWANVVSMETPGQRTKEWIVRIGIPMLVLAALAFLNEHMPLVWAVLTAFVVTLFVNLSTKPAVAFEAVSDLKMREAAVTTSIVAAIVLGISIFIFGMPLLKLLPRAVVIGGTPPLALTSAPGYHVSKPTLFPGKTAPQSQPEESVIDIRWSQKKGQQQAPKTPDTATTNTSTASSTATSP